MARERVIPQALGSSPLFAALSPATREAIAPLFRLRTVRRGSFLFHEGDPAGWLYVVVQGEIKVLKLSPEGHEVILHLATPGDLIGGIALLGEKRYPASAQAQTDVQVATLDGKTFHELARAHPALADQVIKILLARLQEAHETIRQMASERVERRLARLLLRLASRSGKRTDEGVLIQLELTRQDLANMAGTTLETTSRVMSRWQKQSLIATHRRRILICNPHGLVVVAEDLATEPSAS
jgi:CRP-like cAMP-binding protein